MGLLFGLLGLALLVAVIVCIFVLPIIAIARTQGIRALGERLQRLEREVRRLRRMADEPVAEPHERPEVPVAEIVEEPPERPAAKRVPAVTLVGESEHRVETNWAAVEAWIGGRGLGWAAVVLLIFATGFFLKHVFERNLIGELGRVAIGVVIGSALTVAGYRYQRHGWRVFSQMLTAAGIALLYLATFASFGYYRLLDQESASLFLIALVAEAFILAVQYEAPAIALMAVVGGLLAPVLLHSDQDRHRSLFAYLAVLDAGVIVLTVFRHWWAVGSVALIGTHLLFWFWHWEHYHPAKLAMCLVFHGTIFTLFAAQGLLSHVVRRRPANLEDLIRILVNALLTAVAGHVLLDADYHHWMGTLALGMAICFTLQTWLAEWGRPASRVVAFVLLAVAMGFLAMVFPLQADAAWIGVGWAAQGLALWWFGLRTGILALRGLGAVLLTMAALRLLLFDTLLYPAHVEPFVPIFNKYGIPALTIAGSLVAAALVARRHHPAFGSLDFVSMRVLGLAGAAVAWIVLSVEAYDFFLVQIDQPPGLHVRGVDIEKEMEPARWVAYRAEREVDLRYTAQVAMSVVWAVYAALLLAAGFRLDNRPLRWGALGLFLLTLGKVVLVDMARLPGFYRVAAFLALSVMMAVGAWGYQKLRHKHTPRTGG